MRTLKCIARFAGDVATSVARGRDSTDCGRAPRSPGHLAVHLHMIASKAVCLYVSGNAVHLSASVWAVKAKASALLAAAVAVNHTCAEMYGTLVSSVLC